MSINFNFRALKADLRNLPGYTALRSAVDARVNALGPKVSPEEVVAVSNGHAAVAQAFAVFVTLRRVAVKAETWMTVAEVLADPDATAPEGFAAIHTAALAMREQSADAVMAATVALTPTASLSPINAEAF